MSGPIENANPEYARRQRIIRIKKVVAIGVAVAIPVTIFVLFKKNISLKNDFQSLYDNYAEVQEAHAVLKDQYLTLADGYLTLSEKVVDKILDNVPQTALADIVHDMA
jgi:hypothetical protein